MHFISERIVRYAVENGIVDDEKTEEYIFGLEITLLLIINYATAIFIGVLFGMVKESIIFVFLYCFLKKYTGGFHFNSQFACYISMCVMCSAVLLIIKHTVEDGFLYSIFMMVSSVVMFVLSPVQAIEKPLDDKEKKVFGFIAKCLTLLLTVTYFLCYAFCFYGVSKIIMVTACSLAIFVILGKIKYILHKKQSCG